MYNLKIIWEDQGTKWICLVLGNSGAEISMLVLRLPSLNAAISVVN